MSADPPEIDPPRELTLVRRSRSAIGGVIASMMALVLMAVVAFLVIGTQRQASSSAGTMVSTDVSTDEAAANTGSVARRAPKRADE